MQKKITGKIKILVTIAIICAFLWFLVISPMITFHNNEKKMEDAARRYFELNARELPTGDRVKTVSLETLYHKSFLKEDLKVPYTGKSCSISNSWVKVKKENNEYKYYTYLECGILSSTVDHKGPTITLKGDEVITLSKGETYKEQGVKSVVDNVDGKMKIDSVNIKGEVDTSKIGTYEIKYTAYDSLSNKGEVTREVRVVQKAYNTIKNTLGDKTNFTGEPENNYVRLSNMMFRIYGIDGDKNVVLVADGDVANVNYSKLNDWLDYYYDNLNETTQKMIVKTKYCTGKLAEDKLGTTKCDSYTKARNVYIPSVVEVNKADVDGNNFMKTGTISWVSNKKDDKTAYVTRKVFFYDDAGKNYLSYSVDDNYGVRPMITIKGSSLIAGGKGTKDDPYVFGDTKVAKGGSKLNERYTGEYVSIDGDIYRIISTEDDGTTKVISNFTLGTTYDGLTVSSNPNSLKTSYNPKDEESVAYYINNSASKYVNTEHFVKHEIEVPIYKSKIIYGSETDTKTYKVVLSAPNMYEMFSAMPANNYDTGSYWLLNTSKADGVIAAITTIGVPMNDKVGYIEKFGIRVVAYLNKNAIVSSGDGTEKSPYIIK